MPLYHHDIATHAGRNFVQLPPIGATMPEMMPNIKSVRLALSIPATAQTEYRMSQCATNLNPSTISLVNLSNNCEARLVRALLEGVNKYDRGPIHLMISGWFWLPAPMDLDIGRPVAQVRESINEVYDVLAAFIKRMGSRLERVSILDMHCMTEESRTRLSEFLGSLKHVKRLDLSVQISSATPPPRSHSPGVLSPAERRELAMKNRIDAEREALLGLVRCESLQTLCMPPDMCRSIAPLFARMPALRRVQIEKNLPYSPSFRHPLKRIGHHLQIKREGKRFAAAMDDSVVHDRALPNFSVVNRLQHTLMWI